MTRETRASEKVEAAAANRGRQPRPAAAGQGRPSSRGPAYGATATTSPECSVEQSSAGAECSAEQGLVGGVLAEEFPLTSLPPLPSRGFGYHTEPMLGVCLVCALCWVLCAVSYNQAIKPRDDGVLPKVCFPLVVCQALTALWCMGRILLATPPDEIQRSFETCYPIPAEVAEKLRECGGEPLEACANVVGPSGSTRLGSYCVRCFVWRPPRKSSAGRSHHCNVCQRCVSGFDHHCNLFGRCIVNGNLTSFYVLIAMMPAGLLTTLLPIVIVGGDFIS